MAWGGKSTDSRSYRYEVDGHEIVVTRTHVGTAYARNGNVGNATEYFIWSATADGVEVAFSEDRRSEAYEVARAHALGIEYVNIPSQRRYVNVRGWTKVQDEMKANYRGLI